MKGLVRIARFIDNHEHCCLNLKFLPQESLTSGQVCVRSGQVLFLREEPWMKGKGRKVLS